MGFLDFLFKSKEEIPEFKFVNSEDIPRPERYTVGIDPLPREYSDKGVGKCKSKKNPWRAYVAFSVRDNAGKKTKSYVHHIGQYPTKEEAQKARWEFIENLK